MTRQWGLKSGASSQKHHEKTWFAYDGDIFVLWFDFFISVFVEFASFGSGGFRVQQQQQLQQQQQ